MEDSIPKQIPSAVLAIFADRVADGVAWLSDNGQILATNPAFLKLFGLTGTVQTSLSALVIGEDVPAMAYALMRGNTTASGENGQLRFRHDRSGAIVPVDFSLYGIASEENPGAGFVMMLRDASARIAVDLKLSVRENELVRLQRIGKVGGFEIDLVGTAMRNHRSPEYLRLHGLTGADVNEHHDDWVGRLHPDDRERIKSQLAESIAGTATDYAANYRIVTSTGIERWISSGAEIERDHSGRALRMIGVHTDISGSKAAEASVRTSETRFRAAVAAVHGIVWTSDNAGHTLGAQPGWTTLTGQSFLDYQWFGWKSAVHPDDIMPTMNAWNAAVTAKRTFEFAHRLKRHDGVWRFFAVTAVPLLEFDGAIREWVGVHIDITEERAAQDALLLLNGELEARVRAEVAEREVAQALLSKAQRLEALGQLAGGIAHDFNNVLQAVQGAATLIQRRPNDVQTVLRLTQMILDASQRGASVTRRLLAFSRQDGLRAAMIDAAGMLSDLSELLSHTIGGSVAVTFECDKALPPLMADKGQLETVLINLATNARDAMPHGGHVTISAKAGEVESSGSLCLKPGSYVCLSVRDTGVGMDAATLARACEPFFTTKPSGHGTGLGLAMARGFAGQSGGALKILSAPREGTTVTMWLPVADAAKDVLPKRDIQAVGRVTRACILLTDDDALVRQTLAENLVARGFDVVQAADAPTALAVLEGGQTINVLISDFSMIGLDGLSLIREAQRLWPELPAILLTGFASEAAAAVVSSRISGRFSLLRKPVQITELCDRIMVLLEGVNPGVNLVEHS